MSNLLARWTVLALVGAAGISACRSEDPGMDDGGGGEPSGGTSAGGKGSGGKGSGGAASGGAGGEGGAPNALELVTLRFRGQIGDALFACGTNYKKQGSTEVEVTPQDFRLYLSEVRLITADGAEVAVQLEERTPWQSSEVALLDFEDQSGQCKNGNSALNDTITGHVPSGDYVGVVFSTSVPKELNHQDPATLPAPLQAGGMTWGWLAGYKFIRAELVATEPAGLGLFHLGSNGCDNRPSPEGGAGGEGGAVEPDSAEPDYGAPPALDCANPNHNEIRLEDFSVSDDVVVIDMGAMMADVDMSADSQCHSMLMQPDCEPLFQAVGLELMTGQTTEGQTTFRVEPR